MDLVVGYLMTGGKNTRMNGRKKIFLNYKGETFGQRIIDALSVLDKVYLSVEASEPYECFGLPMVVDEIKEIGPMGGIYSGLKQIKAQALFVVACDMPFVSQKSINQILQVYEKSGKITLARTKNCNQPLFGIYPKSALTYIEKAIREEKYKMMIPINEAGYEIVELDMQDMSTVNINSVEEYEVLKDE